MSFNWIWIGRDAKFSPDHEFVAAKIVMIGGTEIMPGEPIDRSTVSTRRLRQLYERRRVARADRWQRYHGTKANPVEEIPESDTKPVEPLADGPASEPPAALSETPVIHAPASADEPPLVPRETLAVASLKHEGFGKWSVMVGDDTLEKGLTKEAAQAKADELNTQ
jgi:hypothetical protein